MEDKLRKVALDAKKAEPNDWYAQRTLMHIALLDGNVLYLKQPSPCILEASV